MGCRLAIPFLLCLALAGCGTTKWTDTQRSATEQLLISDAMDRAVSRLDFRALAGRKVYLDAKALQSATDSAYLVSSLRQHMLASGCLLMDSQPEADYIVEGRSGAVGTDHHELVYGIPRVDIPALIPVAGVGIPPNIPELKFVTRTDQRAVVKIAVFAYNRETGRPVWQSGVVPIESDAKAFWVFGAGPFQRGSIYKGTSFAGDKLNIPLIDPDEPQEETDPVSIADEAYFIEPTEAVAQTPEDPEPDGVAASSGPDENAEPAAAAGEVVQTAHTEAEPDKDDAKPSVTDVPPPAASPDQPADSGPAEAPQGGAPAEAPQAKGLGSPSTGGDPPPAIVPLRVPGVKRPGSEASASDSWLQRFLPPLPRPLNPFD